MPGNRKKRRINCNLNSKYFKPQGIPLTKLKEIELSIEEVEALRLTNIIGLDQEACGKEMQVSRQTIQRTLKSAYKKITEALIKGYALKIIT